MSSNVSTLAANVKHGVSSRSTTFVEHARANVRSTKQDRIRVLYLVYDRTMKSFCVAHATVYTIYFQNRAAYKERNIFKACC